MTIQASTRPVALLGYPVGHSLSPLIHNAAFEAQGLDFVYLACPVRPGHVPTAVDGLRALDFAGANVTIPHKQAVLPLVDELSEQARAVGAVNTLVHRRAADGRSVLYGDNTDVAGFLMPLHAHAGALQGAPMVLFGTGGAARAVLYALLTRFRPGRLAVVARDPDRGARLASEMAPYDPGGCLEVSGWPAARPAVRAARLLVNATPLGMHPRVEETVWDAADHAPDQIAYDLVYNPARTRWLREAAERGATTVGGVEMFIGQAADAYRQWTGVEMPVELVRRLLAQHAEKKEPA